VSILFGRRASAELERAAVCASVQPAVLQPKNKLATHFSHESLERGTKMLLYHSCGLKCCVVILSDRQPDKQTEGACEDGKDPSNHPKYLDETNVNCQGINSSISAGLAGMHSTIEFVCTLAPSHAPTPHQAKRKEGVKEGGCRVWMCAYRVHSNFLPGILAHMLRLDDIFQRWQQT